MISSEEVLWEGRSDTVGFSNMVDVSVPGLAGCAKHN